VIHGARITAPPAAGKKNQHAVYFSIDWPQQPV
jgi:hypothetical protein